MKLCIVKFSDGEEEFYKTSFDGLEEEEVIIVEIVLNGELRLSRAKFVKYIDECNVPAEELNIISGRWL